MSRLPYARVELRARGSRTFAEAKTLVEMNIARAAVLTAPEQFELRDFDVPQRVDGAVLALEACGLCGTDLDVVSGSIALNSAVIPGHEPLGHIISISPDYARSTGLEVGDRVVAPAELHCGECTGCLDDESCLASPGTHGFLPVTIAPGLWGGFAEAMVLTPHTRPLRIDASVPVHHAALFNLLGAGWSWAVEAPELRAGQSVVVFGPGQRGLACVLAATSVGADVVAVTGLGERDRHKLEVAHRLGAKHVLDGQAVDLDEQLRAVAPAGVDVVIDTTPHSTAAVLHAIELVRPGGTIVLAGLKGTPVVNFPTDTVALRRLTIRGVRAVTRSGFRSAIAMIESGDDRLDLLHTHHFGIDQAHDAIETLRNDPGAIAVSIGPPLDIDQAERGRTDQSS